MTSYEQFYLGHATAPQVPKVLLVNADREKLARMANTVKRKGFTALQATTYPEAKRLFESEFPQAMIADIRLGEFNGLQLLIRARAVKADIPVIITSDIADPVLEREARSHGARFVVGPVDATQILSWISADSWSAPTTRDHYVRLDPSRLSV